MAKKIGRPARHAGERLAKNRTFRVRGDLDERLQEAAGKAGRSVSEEIEFRLEESFHADAFRQIADDAQVIIDEATKAAASIASEVAAKTVLDILKDIAMPRSPAETFKRIRLMNELMAHLKGRSEKS